MWHKILKNEALHPRIRNFHILLEFSLSSLYNNIEIQTLKAKQTHRCIIKDTDLDVLKEDASSSLVLVGQQLLCVLPLLMAVLLEETGKPWQGHIVSGEIHGLSNR